MVGGRRQEAGGRRQEAEGRRQEAGGNDNCLSELDIIPDEKRFNTRL
ncbi:MAG: hypothetical protein F6K21_05765 [Symploca sp. SIO2D2]|nr:hypothetical protein [Symploca sp. SIO2D2]